MKGIGPPAALKLIIEGQHPVILSKKRPRTGYHLPATERFAVSGLLKTGIVLLRLLPHTFSRICVRDESKGLGGVEVHITRAVMVTGKVGRGIGISLWGRGVIFQTGDYLLCYRNDVKITFKVYICANKALPCFYTGI